MSCDPADYLGEPAALCVAQVPGLGVGSGSCFGNFRVNGEPGKAWWTMMNEDLPDCASGYCQVVDAATGATETDSDSTCAWAD